MYQSVILAGILFLTIYIAKRSRGPKLNAPPLVPYKIPFVGHTISFMYNCEEFLEQCRKEYGDVFSLYTWGEVSTFVGKEHIQEVLVKKEAFMRQAFKNGELPFRFNNISPQVAMKEIKEYIISKLVFYTGRIQKSIQLATQKYIGDCDEPKIIYNISNFTPRIVATPVASLFLGEEEAKHEEVIDTLAYITRDAAAFVAIPPFLNFIYPGLQKSIIRTIFKLGYNPALKHQNVLAKHVKKQVEKRLNDKQKYGDLWKRPDDVLQDYMNDESFDANNVDKSVAAIVDKIVMFVFVSVHSTSAALSDVIMDLASRPEYMQELYEEQLEVHKQADENDTLTTEALGDMKKLDSFIRESLRLAGSVVMLPHLVIQDYTFTNGLQLPKGHMVELYSDDIYGDESTQGSNPKSFEPFRHVGKNPATKVSKSFVLFGGGKHACPGRFFAMSVVKTFMHNAILKYNFRTESGKIEVKSKPGSMAITSPNGIIFEKRVK